MSATVIDGKAFAAGVRARVAERVERIARATAPRGERTLGHEMPTDVNIYIYNMHK